MNYLKFWGTRGSCPISGADYTKYGGNTSCLEISYGKTRLIIDAGTGIRPLGELLPEKMQEIQIFLGHPHLDHLIGFPFFAPAFQPNRQIGLWLPAHTESTGPELFDRFLSFETFPGGFEQIKAALRFYPAFEEMPIQMGEISLHFCLMCHPGVTYGFKIVTPHETIGYITDNEFLKGFQGSLEEITPAHLAKEEKTIRFLQDVDLLIHEAQFFDDEYRTKEGWGHSSISNAIALVQATKAPKWFVTHHDPKHTDADLDRAEQLANKMLQEARIPCQATWVGDGYTYALTPSIKNNL